MKKRFLALALAGVLALSFSGCITSSWVEQRTNQWKSPWVTHPFALGKPR